MESGLLVYKCRRCGKLNKNIHVPKGLIVLTHILADVKLDNIIYEAITPSKTGICSCNDGNLGVSDLIGFEKD